MEYTDERILEALLRMRDRDRAERRRDVVEDVGETRRARLPQFVPSGPGRAAPPAASRGGYARGGHFPTSASLQVRSADSVVAAP